jgi:hypothetical protein
MVIEDYINELISSCGKSDKVDKEILDTYQSHFLNGDIGLVFNKYTKEEKYEVYAYIKTKEQIASPLLYKTSTEKNELELYYSELLDFIKNEEPKNIINRCIIRD